MNELALSRTARVSLEPAALVLPKLGRLHWSDVLGSVRHGEGRRERLYVLLRREGPQLPWVVLNARMLRGSAFSDLAGLAEAIDERLAQTGYRQGARPRPRQDAEDLLEDILAGKGIAGAVEIRRARGPRRMLTLIAEGVASVAAGGFAGSLAGAFAGALLQAIPGVPHGFAGGAMAVCAGLGSTLALASTSLVRRRRRRRARVLVLTPEGCVVGLPQGPQAFLWRNLGPFETSRENGPGANEALRLVDAEGVVVAELDRAWLGAPLELVVAVANAYRTRIV